MEKPRITIRLETEEEYEQLDAWAKEEFLSTPQLVRAIVRRSLASKNDTSKDEVKHGQAHVLPAAPTHTNELQVFLKLLTTESRPSDPDLIEMAHDLELDVHLLYSLRDRLFPTPKRKNGHAS